jgi:RHS repeat-associated protein
MLTDSSGNAQRRYDFLPFGPEIPAGVDGRSSGYLSSPDHMNPKFTGQMRDADTALDFFNVRYLSPAQGRFQSPDPANAGADPADPQTWNAYTYVGNNPLSFTDPSGMGGEGIALGLGCGPVCGGVIAGIETGIEIWRLFGHLGYSGPPVPNWAGTAWQLGPAQPQDQPWSEQNPYASGSGGSFNIGGVFGSGNTDPFVFSFQDSSGGWLANAPTIPGWIVNGVAGAGDKFSFGLTAVIRKRTPGGDATDTNTRSYMVGGWVGTGYQIVFGAALGGTAAAVADGKNGAYFGRGTQTVFNSGKVRFGWNWVGPAETGRDVIRLGIGPARGTAWWSHWNFWFPKAP